MKKLLNRIWKYLTKTDLERELEGVRDHYELERRLNRYY